MAVKETRCYRLVWDYLTEHPYLAIGYRTWAKVLRMAVNTLKAAVAYFTAENRLESEPGKPGQPTIHRIKTDSSSESNLTHEEKIDSPLAAKLTHPICPTCGHSQQLVSHASVNSESPDEDVNDKAYKLAATQPNANEEREAIKAELQMRIRRAHLYEINGEPVDDFTLNCMSRPIQRLPQPWQRKETMEELEEKCRREVRRKEQNAPMARGWAMFTRVVTEKVARFVGTLPTRKPVERAESNDAGDSIAKLKAMGYLKKGAHA